MVSFIIFLFLILFVVIFLFLISRPYINPYRLYMVFGKKGSGKTTYMCKLSLRYSKRGYTVFSNAELPGSTLVNIKLLGDFVPPPGSVLLIDEVGMIWDNRHYKTFEDKYRNFFKLQRQYKNIVYLFSQTFDIDKKLRDLTDVMYMVTCPIPVLSICRRIKRTLVLVQPDGESEGRIADGLEFIPWYMSLFGMRSIEFTWIPSYASFFKSYNPPSLPEFASDPFSLPERRHFFRRRKK